MGKAIRFPARSKYNAVRVGKNASKKEARRAAQLHLLEDAGLIFDLREQVRFELIPAQWEDVPRYGKKGQPLKPGRKCIERACDYVADFVYIEDGKEIVEDSKGMRTPDYKIKRKLMLYIHGIRIRET